MVELFADTNLRTEVSDDSLSNTSDLDSSLQRDDLRRFTIHYLAYKKELVIKCCRSVEQITKEACNLYSEAKLNDGNAIVTYLDNKNDEKVLLDVPKPLEKNESMALFIRHIHPACSLCAGSFGILEAQLLFECPNETCGEQYCNNCCVAIQSSAHGNSFTCINCRKSICPKQNIVLEKYIIWPNMMKSYGTESLRQLQNEQRLISTQNLLQDINFRQIHLRCRLDSFLNQSEKQLSNGTTDRHLTTDAEDLIDKLGKLKVKVEKIKSSMRERGSLVIMVVQKHQKNMKDFDKLSSQIIAHLQQNNAADGLVTMVQDTMESYPMENLQQLPSDENLSSINTVLEDIVFWKMNVSRLDEKLSTLIKEKRLNSSKDLLEKLAKRSDKLEKHRQELDWLRGNFREIQKYVEEYIMLLTDERQPSILGSRFIYILEELRIETERLEIGGNFPSTMQLVTDWWNDFGSMDNFKPKVIDLCKALETDLKNCFDDQNSIYNIPYRIGVIGSTSVGKSALIMNIAQLKHYTSMINLERSTFGYLEFDVLLPESESSDKKIPITFVDIAGATDESTSKSIGNYLELISNADCDLYMIIFDKPFNRQHKVWFDFVQNDLKRQCLLVRSKVDLIFATFYKDIAGDKFHNSTKNFYSIRCTLQKTRHHAKTTFDEKHLDQEIFLTAAGEENEFVNENFGAFDLKRLKQRLRYLALHDHRVVRVEKLALTASQAAINTCFRRDYAVSQTKYRWLAAGASIFPFLDEVPAFFGREQIRQAFGVHDRSSLTNTYYGTKNSLEEYLLSHQFKVPKDTFKSGYFEYLIADEQVIIESDLTTLPTTSRSSSTYIPGPSIIGTVFSTVGAMGQIFRDAIKVGLPAATGALRVASIAGIIVGIVLTPITAAWSFYSSGKRMNQHLHLLCDDIQVMLIYFIYHVCDQYKANTSLPQPLEENDSSAHSSDDEDDPSH